MKQYVILLAAASLTLSAIACGDDTGKSGGGDDIDEPSGGQDSSQTSSDNGSSSASKAKFGEDCLKGSECEEGKCLTFTTDRDVKMGFCTRQCTQAADCPEEGWECSLSPYTACIPKND